VRQSDSDRQPVLLFLSLSQPCKQASAVFESLNGYTASPFVLNVLAANGSSLCTAAMLRQSMAHGITWTVNFDIIAAKNNPLIQEAGPLACRHKPESSEGQLSRECPYELFDRRLAPVRLRNGNPFY